jgi:hypothetical protein
MLCRRFATKVAVAAVATRWSSVKSHDPTYEDDRWLEAEIADKNKTPEEKYAAEQQAKLLKTMMARMRDHTEKTVAEHKKDQQSKHDSEVARLKAEMDELKNKLNSLEKE